MAKPICSVSDCERESYIRGYCIRHYQRLIRYGDPMIQKRVIVRGTVEDRFWAKVNKLDGEDACWEWTAWRSKHGYGQFARDVGGER